MSALRRRGVLCLVSDRRRLASSDNIEQQLRALLEQARAASEAGVDLFQIRERDLAAAELLRITSAVLDAVRGSTMRVLVNDRLDVAIAAGAHGVQLKGAGIGDAAARHLAPAGFLIGRSIHSVEEAVRTAADFLIFGTVYPTASKGPHQTVTGLEPLAAAARAASVPVLAIGGIDATRAPDVARVADGIAAIGWFSTIDRVKLAEAVREAREAFDSVEPPHLE